jgi:hypothetical protein
MFFHFDNHIWWPYPDATRHRILIHPDTEARLSLKKRRSLRIAFISSRTDSWSHQNSLLKQANAENTYTFLIFILFHITCDHHDENRQHHPYSFAHRDGYVHQAHRHASYVPQIPQVHRPASYVPWVHRVHRRAGYAPGPPPCRLCPAGPPGLPPGK